MSILTYAGAFLAMFLETFLRGFQNKNVHSNKEVATILVGFFMCLLDMLVIGLVVHGGYVTAVFGAVGASLGWVISIRAHKYLNRKQILEAKIAKKAKRKQRIKRAVEKQMRQLPLLDKSFLN
jgi:heme exporter protein D